ncbi:MAG: HEPN domain-containing protein, partial [Candidatus Methanodesulfokora sp.]
MDAVSGELVDRSRRRALVFLDEAENLANKGEHDVACFNAEQATQLYLKSVILKIFGEIPRTHSIGALLGYLADKLEEGYEEEGSRIRRFAADNRDILV